MHLKKNLLVFGLCVFVVQLSIFLCLKLLELFRDGGGCLFQRGGAAWEVCAAIAYGFLPGAFIFVIFQISSNYRHKKNVNIFAIVSLVAIYVIGYNVFDKENSIDKLIAELGFQFAYIAPQRTIFDSPIPSEKYKILPPFTEIVYKSRQGNLAVSLGAGSLRTIRWSTCKKLIEVVPNLNDRGIALRQIRRCDEFPGSDWCPCESVSQCIYDEQSIHFSSVTDFNKFLEEQAKDGSPMSYTADGLCIGWKISKMDHLIRINIVQAYINNKKPNDLPSDGLVLISVKH
jgi:hypothetical protein